MTKKRFGSMGASSVLMIFIVLCLTAFGVLSLVSARSDLRLTNRALTAAEEYYAADARTEALLSAVDQKLTAARTALALELDRGTVAPEEADARYASLFQESLAEMEAVTLLDDRLLLKVPAGKDREIQTLLELLPLNEQSRYRVISRQLCSTQAKTWGMTASMFGRVINFGLMHQETEGTNSYGNAGAEDTVRRHAGRRLGYPYCVRRTFEL